LISKRLERKLVRKSVGWGNKSSRAAAIMLARSEEACIHALHARPHYTQCTYTQTPRARYDEKHGGEGDCFAAGNPVVGECKQRLQPLPLPSKQQHYHRPPLPQLSLPLCPCTNAVCHGPTNYTQTFFTRATHPSNLLIPSIGRSLHVEPTSSSSSSSSQCRTPSLDEAPRAPTPWKATKPGPVPPS
jgi:hypothetical protein